MGRPLAVSAVLALALLAAGCLQFVAVEPPPGPAPGLTPLVVVPSPTPTPGLPTPTPTVFVPVIPTPTPTATPVPIETPAPPQPPAPPAPPAPQPPLPVMPTPVPIESPTPEAPTPTPPPTLTPSPTPTLTPTPTPAGCAGDETFSISPLSPRAGDTITVTISSSRAHVNVALQSEIQLRFLGAEATGTGYRWRWAGTVAQSGRYNFTFYVNFNQPCLTATVDVLPPATPAPTSTPTPLPAGRPSVAAPVIRAISPTSGTVGTSVTVTGSNFGSQAGSFVTFGGVPATEYGSWSDTAIVVTVPGGVRTGDAVVEVVVWVRKDGQLLRSNAVYFRVR